jgi:hypothetical protein
MGTSCHKAHEVVLSNKRRIADLPCWTDAQFCTKAVQQNPWALQYCKALSEQQKLELIRECGLRLKDISNASPAVQLAAVQESGYALRYVTRPTRETQWAAIDSWPLAIMFVSDPDKDIQLLALGKSKHVFRFIKHPCPEVLLLMDKN